MSRYGESIIGTQSGLEPWQFYGSSTRRDNFYYLHLLMKPYETISVRGIPLKRVKSVTVLGSDEPLTYSTRCSIIDELTQANPLGELTISVPESVIDPLATAISLREALRDRYRISHLLTNEPERTIFLRFSLITAPPIMFQQGEEIISCRHILEFFGVAI